VSKVATGVGVLVLWACASGALMVAALLSVSSIIITAAICVCAACLVISTLLLALERKQAAFVFASGPGIVVAAIIGVSMAAMFIDQWLH
jgi:hypothetical protein